MKRALPLLLIVLMTGCREESPAPAPSTPEPAAVSPDAPAEPTAAATSAALPVPGQVPRAFLCRGNEPFWSLDIRADSALLKTPESEADFDGELLAGSGGSFRFQGSVDGAPDEIVEALVSPAQCFDTMADGPASPFSAQVSLPDGRAGSGCCTAEFGLDLANAPVFDAAAQGPDDWSRHWPDLADSIGHCARDGGVATDVITTAWPMNRGKAVVRLRDTGQARFDCRVDLGTGKIEAVSAVPEGELQPGEAQPVFIPARQGPPVLDCGQVQRVMVGGDAVVGYLHYTAGCG
ncbi:hypothetical protein [Arenimonas sp. MALMAid1274]|uniref:hypothetical protein n=1 Tax=Arenimonas sp. MALMAid1274 TaxID=3411630 RepID=UPI003BA2BAE3